MSALTNGNEETVSNGPVETTSSAETQKKLPTKRRRATNEPVLIEPVDIPLDASSSESIARTFPSPDHALSDYQLYRIVTSELSSKERAVIYKKEFDRKGYILGTRLGRGRAALLTHNGQEHYAIVCGNVQLHGAEGTLKKLEVHKEGRQSLEADAIPGDPRSNAAIVTLPRKVAPLPTRSTALRLLTLLCLPARPTSFTSGLIISDNEEDEPATEGFVQYSKRITQSANEALRLGSRLLADTKEILPEKLRNHYKDALRGLDEDIAKAKTALSGAEQRKLR